MCLVDKPSSTVRLPNGDAKNTPEPVEMISEVPEPIKA